MSSNREGEEASALSPEVIDQLREAASQGSAEAQFRLGTLYGNGEGVELDHGEALRWFRDAARQGHEQALITLAWMYANGKGVEADEARARELYMMAAEHGSTKAQYLVATFHRFGELGLEQDLQRALHFYQLAANAGHAGAQFALGRLLFDGKQVARDDVGALQWLMLADAGGNKRAEEYIRQLLGRMSGEDVQRARSSMPV